MLKHAGIGTIQELNEIRKQKKSDKSLLKFCQRSYGYQTVVVDELVMCKIRIAVKDHLKAVKDAERASKRAAKEAGRGTASKRRRTEV